jgi:hypothetical protein
MLVKRSGWLFACSFLGVSRIQVSAVFCFTKCIKHFTFTLIAEEAEQERRKILFAVINTYFERLTPLYFA